MDCKIKLLPCAHCGSGDTRLYRTRHHDFGDNVAWYYGWHIECEECGMQTQVYPEAVDNDTDMDDSTFAHVAMDDAITCAVEAWNKRTTTDNNTDMATMSNDDLVALIKRATDTLTDKANNLITDIFNELNKDDNNG